MSVNSEKQVVAKHHDKHSKKHEHSQQHGHDSKSSGAGKNVWLVVAVILMLVCMGIYVLSDDKNIRPGDEPGQRVPADAGE